MAPFHFLFQEHFGSAFRRQGRSRSGLVTAVDQGQLHPLPDGGVRDRLGLAQAEAENFGRHVLEFPPLLHGTHFHGAQEIVWKIESRFHGDNFPAFQLSVKLDFRTCE